MTLRGFRPPSRAAPGKPASPANPQVSGSSAGALGTPIRAWPRYLSLTAQFSIVSSAVLLLGMLIQGTWISSTIEEKAKYHAGTAATLFVDHVIAPYFAALPIDAELTAAQRDAIDALVQRASQRMQIAAMKIWSRDGTILYSTNPAVVGQTFEMTEPLRVALAGRTSVEFDVLDEPESQWERHMGLPLIEVYVPIHNVDGLVVAVAEFYENAELLNSELLQSQHDTWLVTGAVFVTMIASLLCIVTRGSRLIEQQRRCLTEKVHELSDLLQQNSLLQGRVERASQLAAEESEQFLHRLGADLHDGPAQLISFALLRLDTVAPSCGSGPEPSASTPHGEPVRSALTEAMNEVRNICAGLSMPGIANLQFSDALASVIKQHERRTGTTVSSHLVDLPTDTPHFVKASLCRFVQEGLNNAFRHADAQGQSVAAWTRDGSIIVEVIDSGPGIALPLVIGPRGGLGLAGLAKRLESLGGTMLVSTVSGKGSRLTATMPIIALSGSRTS